MFDTRRGALTFPPMSDQAHTPKSLLALKGLTVRRCAELSEVSRPTVSAILRGDMNVVLSNVAAVAKILNVSTQDLVEAMGRAA